MTVARVVGRVLRTFALTAPTLALLGAGCSIEEHVCRSSQYPVKAVGNRTGRACVPDGEPPPSGYVRYPAGKEPVYVDDEWDRYWRTVVVDRDGNIVEQTSTSGSAGPS